jgi:Omp85 superfamily domain
MKAVASSNIRRANPRGIIALCASAGAPAFLVAPSALADPLSLSYGYSEYETRAIRDAEALLGVQVDRFPEGKIVERIDFVRLDPIDRHDPLPVAVNALHATSRVSVLRHELLTKEGDPYRGVLVDESARNLRGLPQVSLVLCMPMNGSRPDLVRLVVITKDVWSLYVDFDFTATPGGLELLDLEPKETNVAGLQHRALLRFVLQPKSYSLGASYEIPRLDGRFLDLLLDGNVIVNRDSSDPEGSYGTAGVTHPLYSSHARWAWTASVDWMDQVNRRYTNASVDLFKSTPAAAAAPVQWMWRERTIVEQIKLTRSFGWTTKNDFSIGATISHAIYRVPSDASTDAAARSDFQRAAVPVGEDRVGPFAQWHTYSSAFQRVVDLDTLGLQEDNRLGHDVWLRAYPVLHALGSTRDLVGIYAAAAYTIPIHDGLARASIASTMEGEPDRISDASLEGGLAVVTPRIGTGRLIFETTALDRWRNYLNVLSYVGGDSLLRGYPSRFLAGKDMLAANLEFRSRSVQFGSIQFGAAAFFDAGAAFDSFDHIEPRRSLGLGLRMVLPQIERAVLRFDLGFPIDRPIDPATGQPIGPASFFVAFNQALSLPVVGARLAP